jgi:long-chain acyl-CoA synthetase
VTDPPPTAAADAAGRVGAAGGPDDSGRAGDVGPGPTLADLLPPPGDELCVHAGGRDHSRSDVHARVDEIARALAQVVEPGATVGVMLPTGADAVAALFAAWRVGAVHVPLNPRFTDTELARVLAQVGASAVVTTPDQAPRLPAHPTVTVADGSVAVIARARRDIDPPAATTSGVASGRHGPGVAIVSFTSGTTGTPAPVPLDHARVIEGLDQVLGTLRARPGGGPPMPNLVPVSLSLWAGIYQVLFAFRAGAPVVLMDRFDTGDFAALVRRFAIRSTVLPPAAMVMLVDDERIAELAPLRYVRSISSPLSPLQARRFRDRFGIRVLNGYGQTELGGEVVGWSAADSKAFGDAKLGSVGRPHAGVEVDTDGGTGELLVRIAGRTDGWHHTGDVGRVDEDGFVWIDGRLSDMVNRGGLKVHPGEVEEVLRLSPAVADAAVVGIPDDRLGEVPVAFVVPAARPAAAGSAAGAAGDSGDAGAAGDSGDARAAGDGGVDAAALDALCREHLAPYKVPVRFERVAALPRNEAGKLLRRELA